MKIILVLSPSWGIETPHLGMALLVAGLRRQGFEVEVYDFNIQVHNKYKEKGLWKSEEDVHWEDATTVSRFIDENSDLLNSFVNKICSTDARVIGFSIYNTTQILSLELAKRIKEKDKNKLIILGGQQCFPKAAAEWLIKDESVDAVVIGEGDEVLPELIGKIEKLKRIDFCPGLIYKENGKIVDCRMRPPVSNLDYFPYPDFSDFSIQSYDNPHQLPILSSRGCPYPCVFCSTKLFWIRYRSMSGERIFREVEYQLNKYKDIHFFTFNDHVINANMKSLSCFCDLVLEEKLKRGKSNSNWEKLNWRGAAVIRPEMDKEFLRKMKEAGCIELEYGIESGSPRIRELMKKYSASTDVIERVLRDTYEVGINVRANFMFGFPRETEQDFQDTLDFLKRNKNIFTQVHPSETFCHIDPGTYLVNNLDEFDISANALHSLYWESKDGQNTYPERLRRHQEFCQLAISLDIPLSPGGHKIMLHKDYFLGKFFRYKETIFAKKEEIQMPTSEELPKNRQLEKIKEEDKLNSKQRFLRVFIDVTNKCNLKCIMCRVHCNDEPRCDMPLDLYKKIAVQTFPYVKELWISCAYESFIVKDFTEMLGYIKEYNIPTSNLVTNATLLNEANIYQLINVGLECLFISIEGAQKITYERIRRGANFEITLSRINLLNRLKEEASSIKPNACFMTTLMRSNIEELQQLIMLASRFKISTIALKPIHVQSPEMESESLQNYKDKTAQYLAEAKKIAEEFGVKLNLGPDLQNLIDTKEGLQVQKDSKMRKCSEAQPVMYISSGGKIKPCPVWKGMPMGDFNFQDFWQIWENNEFKKLRSEITSGNFGEVCLKCRYLI